jgi:hypothetical protein
MLNVTLGGRCASAFSKKTVVPKIKTAALTTISNFLFNISNVSNVQPEKADTDKTVDWFEKVYTLDVLLKDDQMILIHTF